MAKKSSDLNDKPAPKTQTKKPKKTPAIKQKHTSVKKDNDTEILTENEISTTETINQTINQTITEDELATDPVDITENFTEEHLVQLDENLRQQIAQLWWRWANFEIIINSPELPVFNTPNMIQPEKISADEYEFVYPILDYGNRMLTSKQQELFSAGLSMCKLHYTIEKIINIILERLQLNGADSDHEVHVSIEGHISAKRKAFESIINLEQNIMIDNFDPADWGEKYLAIIKNQLYGYPQQSPRDIYKRTYHSTKSIQKPS